MKRGANIFPENKSGQVTLFIIVAIVLVVAGVLAYLFYPGIKSSESQLENPQAFIESCIEDKIEETVEIISLQGGDYEPGFSFTYEGKPVKYLCYTSEDYTSCGPQESLLIKHIEEEILKEIEQEANDCFDAMVDSYEGEGYDVAPRKGDIIVELLPEIVLTTIDHEVTLERGGDSQNYENFRVPVNNNIYELASIARSMVQLEVDYGDVPTDVYMSYYTDIIIEKQLHGDGTKVYIIEDLDTNDVFQFASRSWVR